jgi:hypothetical protein
LRDKYKQVAGITWSWNVDRAGYEPQEKESLSITMVGITTRIESSQCILSGQITSIGRDETQNLKNFLPIFAVEYSHGQKAECEAQMEGDGVSPPRNYLDMPLNIHFLYGGHH